MEESGGSHGDGKKEMASRFFGVCACHAGAAGAPLPPSAVSGLLRGAPPQSGWPKTLASPTPTT